MSNDISEYVAVRLELTKIAEEIGVREAAIDDLLFLWGNQFSYIRSPDGSRALIHTDTGKPAKEYCHITLRATKPHIFPTPCSPDLLEQCFGDSPSLTAQGELYRSIGREAEEKARRWNTTFGSLKPGRRPPNDEAPEPPPKPGSKNPWLAANWSITAQGSLIKALGTEKAAAIARSAGCRIGDTKPKRRS